MARRVAAGGVGGLELGPVKLGLVQQVGPGLVLLRALGDDGPTGGFYREGKPLHW
jgi:hypothetical protein